MKFSKFASSIQEPFSEVSFRQDKTPTSTERINKAKNPWLSIFIAKTYQILQNNHYADVISWNQNGLSFTIHDIKKFEAEVLSIYFRHRNFSSFVRQLNMYDFHKIRTDRNLSMFQHKQFRRGCKKQFGKIKRKGCTRKQSGVEEEQLEFRPIIKHNLKNRQSTIVEQNIKKQLLEEFINTLPEILYSQQQIQQKMRELKFNPKYQCLSSKDQLRKIYQKIKNRKLSKIQDLEDLSIEEEIMVNGIEQIEWNPSMATLKTEKFLPYRSVSLVESLNHCQDLEIFLNM